MADLRFIRFDNARTFLEVTKQADDYLMKNSGALSISDYRHAPTDLTRVFYLAVCRGETLLITLVYGVKEGFPWVLSVPRRAEDFLTPDVLTLALTHLVNSVLSLPFGDPAIIHPMRVFGVEGPVNAFLATWVAAQRARGLRLRLRLAPNPPAIFVTYMTRDTVASGPPPQSVRSAVQHRIHRASVADVESLIPFYTALFATHSGSAQQLTPVNALARLQADIPTRLIWVCRTDGVLSAFAELGRVTPRTITIQSVYVSPEHRQRGVAEALVRAISRHYLGLAAAAADTMLSGPPGPPLEGVKDQIRVNVADASAESLYRHLGFLLPNQSQGGAVLTGGVDRATGRPGWYRSIWREVEPDPGPSTKPRGGSGTGHKQNKVSMPDMYIYMI